MQTASTIVRDKEGNVVSTTPCSQAHPLGHAPRDAIGRILIGALAGQWEPGSPDAPSNPSSRTAQIIAAFAQVDRTNPDNLTANGKPKVEAIEAMLGEQISYQVRDLVWRHLNPPADAPTTAVAVADQAADIDARQSLIVRAIRRLDRDNKDLWMPKGGKPRTEAIEALIGGDVSAAERDAAWQIVSKE